MLETTGKGKKNHFVTSFSVLREFSAVLFRGDGCVLGYIIHPKFCFQYVEIDEYALGWALGSRPPRLSFPFICLLRRFVYFKRNTSGVPLFVYYVSSERKTRYSSIFLCNFFFLILRSHPTFVQSMELLLYPPQKANGKRPVFIKIIFFFFFKDNLDFARFRFHGRLIEQYKTTLKCSPGSFLGPINFVVTRSLS